MSGNSQTTGTASVSTHILDTTVGRPAEGVAITLSARTGPDAQWVELGGSKTDADGRCKDLPTPPPATQHVRLDFAVEAYLTRFNQPADSGASGAFFPEVAITFAVTPGEHYHVPLLLNPFGYSVYRGS